jgi:D-alanyl-D-alanine carboxypeptidase
MNLILKIFLIFSFFIFSNSLKANEYEGCSDNNAYVVFEEKNRNILLEKNSDEKIFPASLVKLMTLYLTFEAIENKKLNINNLIKISQRAEEISRVNKVNTLHLRQGQFLSVREAILAIIVRSFNEAAIALAEVVGEDEWHFVKLMNKKAQELGMYQTSFSNSSGLHSPSQYTTARDLARLAVAIKKDFPDYYHLFSLKNFKFKGQKYKTHNHILEEYQGAEGLKTGFTNASGFNLIASAYKSKVRIISVLIGCSSASRREAFTKVLLNRAFEKIPDKIYPEISGKIIKNFSYEDVDLYTSRKEEDFR